MWNNVEKNDGYEEGVSAPFQKKKKKKKTFRPIISSHPSINKRIKTTNLASIKRLDGESVRAKVRNLAENEALLEVGGPHFLALVHVCRAEV